MSQKSRVRSRMAQWIRRSRSLRGSTTRPRMQLLPRCVAGEPHNQPWRITHNSNLLERCLPTELYEAGRGRAQKLIASLERDPGSIPAIASFKKEKFISSKWHVERRLRRFFIRRDKVKLLQFSSVPTGLASFGVLLF